MGNNDENNGDGTGAGRFPKLNDRQEIMFESALDRFEEYLLTEGKNPLKQKGYAEDSIDSRVSRVLKAIYYIWKIDGITMEITKRELDINTKTRHRKRHQRKNLRSRPRDWSRLGRRTPANWN